MRSNAQENSTPPRKRGKTVVAVILLLLAALAAGYWFCLSPTAQYRQGMALHYEHRYRKAAECFRKAAEAGLPEAQFQLGYCYYHELGVPHDPYTAVNWFRKAAAQGNADAQKLMGYCYRFGRGVPQDKDEAARWYSQAWETALILASEDDDAHAQYLCGQLRSMCGDKESAARWYRRSAEKGDPDGQYCLAHFYECGFGGLPEDPFTAVEWYRKAAEQGHSEAQYSLALCYEHGTGVAKDLTLAREWARKSEAHDGE